MRCFYFLVLLCALSACGHTADKRELGALSWLTSTPSEFANDGYITAIGSGITPEEAANNARAAIAQTFVVRIRQQGYQSSQINAQDGEETVRRYGGISTRTLTDEVLEGVPIVRQGLRQSDNRWYALAALHKRTAAQQLRQAMDALDTNITKLLNQLDAQSPLARIALLRDAQTFLQQRDGQLNRYRVVANAPYPSVHEAYPFAKQQQSARMQATIALELVSDDASVATDILAALRITVVDMLQKSGYQTSEDGMYHVRMTAQLLPISERTGWYWQHMNIAWQLHDTSDPDKQLVVKQMQVRAAATQKTMLNARLQERVTEELLIQLVSSFEIKKQP